MESFSKITKQQLKAIEIKKKCCRFTQNAIESNTDLTEVYSKCLCEGCTAVLVREMFVKYGSVTDPSKQYHLDFSFKTEEECSAAEQILSECGFDFRRTMRRSRFILYIKESSAIEDFLVFIGAQNAAFEVMNSKIVHEFRNSVNRQVNCDTANIGKQLNSGKKYIDAIKFLEESGKFDTLSDELKETAKARVENDQLSLADLGQLLHPPVTKSGVRHRLDKILYYAQTVE